MKEASGDEILMLQDSVLFAIMIWRVDWTILCFHMLYWFYDLCSCLLILAASFTWQEIVQQLLSVWKALQDRILPMAGS